MKPTALVTGGGRGIGFAVAKRLGLDGNNVVIMGMRPEEQLDEAFSELERAGIAYHYVRGDVSSREDRQLVIDETVKAFGGLHILVNNAGVAPLQRNDLLEMTEESFDRVTGINTKANMFLTQAAAKQMLKQEVMGKKRGTIVNISSCSAEASSVTRGEYCVSKAGISMLTKLYADWLAGEGILVHEVRPGVIATDMTAAVQEKYDRLIAEGAFPIARWGTPEDVAGAVSALCSDDFLYTTGNYIDVDGGFHIRRL